MRAALRSLARGAALGAAAALSAHAALAEERLAIPYVPTNAIYWDIDVATDKDFFREAGFAPEHAVSPGSVQSIQIMLSGGAELTVSQPEAVLAALLRGGNGFAIIAAPADRRDWYLIARPEIKSWVEIKGKSLGFGGLKVGEYWLTVEALKAHGIMPAEYGAIEVGTSGPRYAALQRGSIAAAVLYQPTGEMAVKAGFHLLYRFVESPDPAPAIVYSISRSYAAEAQHGMRISRVLARAHQWLYDPANRDEAIAILAKYTRFERNLLAPVYDLYIARDKLLTPDAAVSIAGIKATLATMVAYGAAPAGSALAPEQYLLPKELGGLYR